jgi:predicted nuclease of predicted toxin-antitoxin system
VRILLDHCAPKRLRRFLPAHAVKTTREMGWDRLTNGALLDQAQTAFDVLLTVDQNLRYQQRIAGRPIALVVLVAPDNRVTTLAQLVPELDRLLPTVQPGQVYELHFPPAPLPARRPAPATSADPVSREAAGCFRQAPCQPAPHRA